MIQRAKKTSYSTGIAAGALCRLALRLKGYGIVAVRYKSKLGEIDIIAKRGHSLALVEVKERPSRDIAAEAILTHQQERLARAAADFIARHPKFARHRLRFDVMLVAPWNWPVHIRDAWRPE